MTTAKAKDDGVSTVIADDHFLMRDDIHSCKR